MAFVVSTLDKPCDEVVALVEFAIAGLPRTDVMEFRIKKTRIDSPYMFRGTAYCNRYTPHARLIKDRRIVATVSLGSDCWYPHKMYAVTLQDWKDALVYLVAHEARHLDQKLSGRKLSKAGKESDAANFALQKIAEFQRVRYANRRWFS